MSDAQPKEPFPSGLAAACMLLLAGFGLIVGGVYVLAGLGWALVAGAAPCLLLSAVILRGLK